MLRVQTSSGRAYRRPFFCLSLFLIAAGSPLSFLRGPIFENIRRRRLPDECFPVCSGFCSLRNEELKSDTPTASRKRATAHPTQPTHACIPRRVSGRHRARDLRGRARQAFILVEQPFSIFRERKNEGPPFADSTVGARPAVTKIQILDHARHPPRGILAAVLEHPSPRQPAPHRAPRTHPEADNSPRQFPAFLGASTWGLVTSRQTFVRRRHSTP